MSYSGGGGGYDRRGGYEGSGQGGGYDQRGQGGYDQRGGGGYDQRGGSGGGGYDQRGGSGGGGYDQRGSGGGGYDQRSSSGGYGSGGYSGGSGGGGYDQRGYDDYRSGGGERGYDSRSGYGGSGSGGGSGYSSSSRDYASGSGSYGGSGSGGGGYGDYYGGSSSSSGGYGGSSSRGGYDDRSSYGGSYSGSSSSGYGRGYEGSSSGGYKDERGGYDSRSSGYGGGSGYSRDDRGGGSYSSRGYDDRSGGGSSYGGSDRGGGGDRYGSSSGGDRYGGGSSSGGGGYDRRGGGRDDDRRGGRDDDRRGGRDDDRRGGRDDERRGGRDDDRGGRGFGRGGGGGRGFGGGRGGGQMGAGAGAVVGSGYEQIGNPIQDPRLADQWSGNTGPLGIPDDHQELHRQYMICNRPNISAAGRTININVNYFGLSFDTNKVREIFKYHVAVDRSADLKYGPGGAEAKDEPMTGAEAPRVKQETEDVEMVDSSNPPPAPGRGDRQSEKRPLSKQIVRMVINEALRTYEAEFGGIKLAHDGMSAIYAPVRLPFTHRVFKGINPNNVGAQQQQSGQPQRGRGPPTFEVTIKEVETIPVTDLDEYYRDPSVNPMRLIQALDVVARHLGSQRMIPVGRNLFSVKKTHPLQGGKELCWGYHQSIRIGQRKLLLNIDQAATVFYAPESLLNLALSAMRARNPRDLDRLDERQLRQLNRALRKIEVVPTHRSDRKKPIQGVSSIPVDAIMQEIKGRTISVAQYFAERYGTPLKYPFLPAVNVGSKKKETWLPLELCDVAPGQRCANINDLDTAEIIRKTSQKPRERRSNVMEQVHGAGFENDPYLAAFGLRVDQTMENVTARQLDTPEVQYKNVSERPNMGAWNLRDKEFVDGATLENWGVVVEPGVGMGRGQIDNFIRAFCDTAQKCGMRVHDRQPPILDGSDRRGMSIEELMKECVVEIERKSGGTPRLLMVIKRDTNVGSYGEIKRVSDTVLGIPSQCIVSKNVPKANPQYCANVCLKVNMKLSGKNSVLRDTLPLISEVPTIIIGADVEHPRSGMGNRPSIASVVASLDRYSAKYIGRVASQKGNDIQRLPGMLRDLFLAYYKHTGRKPERVIYYRDGVSEGQFYDILQTEMKALRQACLMMEDGYVPPVTFIVTNKRHHMRGFGDQNLDRSGNLMPGTIVDTGIVDAHRFDFFLYGHSGIQGTSCPAHYTVLFDENQLSADKIQLLTYNLCYTYQRCTRSVSVVPPVYYAHLAAARARFFLNEGSDGASTIGSYNSNSSNFEFADLHKNMLNCMFFV